MESWNKQLRTKISESEFSYQEISDRTKIPLKYIEAIEKEDFKKLPAEIFAKSQIERLFKFLGIDPTNALKDYEEFISPPDLSSEEEILKDTESLYQKYFSNLNLSNINNLYLKYGSILLICIFLIITFFVTKDDSGDFSDNNTTKNTLESSKIINQDLFLIPAEDELIFDENAEKYDLVTDENLEDLISRDTIRKIEIVIKGESWVVVFDKNERLLYELMQTGSYEFSGISPLRFKIGFAPATDLYIDEQKVSFTKAIKGATNYAHFWVNEENKVESIRD